MEDEVDAEILMTGFLPFIQNYTSVRFQSLITVKYRGTCEDLYLWGVGGHINKATFKSSFN